MLQVVLLVFPSVVLVVVGSVAPATDDVQVVIGSPPHGHFNVRT